MEKKINPFHELYVTEIIGPDDYIIMFSPYLCKHEHALPIFQPGNVVLKGTMGSGKSMLLTLLNPETRIAYKKAGVEFPIPRPLCKFISAGINLQTCGVLDFGQRRMVDNEENNKEITPIYFGDYFNFWIVDSLLASIELYLGANHEFIEADLGISKDRNSLDSFAVELANNRCWFGYFSNIRGWDDFRNQILSRIDSYKSFLNSVVSG